MNEIWDIHLKKWAYQCEYLEQFRIMEDKLGKEIDAIVTPVSPTAAILHDQVKYYAYTTVVNLLDFTSVVVPVTFADKGVDRKVQGYEALNKIDGVVQNDCEFSLYACYRYLLTCLFLDDPEAYHGAPVAVQVIGRRLTEERTMAIAEEIGKLLGNEIIP